MQSYTDRAAAERRRDNVASLRTAFTVQVPPETCCCKSPIRSCPFLPAKNEVCGGGNIQLEQLDALWYRVYGNSVDQGTDKELQ